MDKQKQILQNRVKEIIKYTASRRYFSTWSPEELNQAYLEGSKKFPVGTLSINDICDSLWNEMSYNPKRFGTQSPFEFNGKNSLKDFIEKEIDENDENFEILSALQGLLYHFSDLMSKYDGFFEINGYSTPEIFEISATVPNISNSLPVPNKNYKMLDYLRRSIKKIALQNMKDFKYSQYRQQIIEVALSRHPDLNRPRKIENFAEKQRQIQKCLSDKSCIENAILNKSAELSLIQENIVEKMEEKLTHEKQKIITLQNAQHVM